MVRSWARPGVQDLVVRDLVVRDLVVQDLVGYGLVGYWPVAGSVGVASARMIPSISDVLAGEHALTADESL